MDAIDHLAGIAPGSFLDTLRHRKPVTRDNAQASFDALFSSSADMSAAERMAVAYFVASLHEDAPGAEFYRDRLHHAGVGPEALAVLEAEIGRASASGPYGHYPAGPLSTEDQPGPTFAVTGLSHTVLGPRLSAALTHAHMLMFHPRDSAPPHMRALEAGGWSATGIVTLSQLVSFLSFQLRVAAGLRALERSRA